jgi:pimeloyl-ACP methyl ester carboxylesterase
MIGTKFGLGWRGVFAGAALLALAGCGSDDETKPPATASLAFEQCPVDLPGSTRNRTCATASVPLRWDDPKGQSIELLVARYQGSAAHHGQLWLLDGGPGGTGGIYMQNEVLELYQSLGLDIYIPQHRGTGHSTPLDCVSKDDVHACGEELLDTWGDGLEGFHSVEAGRDVGYLINRTRAPGERVFVFGLSYGSYWAQRYLQAFPKQASGVILEGVLPLDEPLWAGDVLADASGRSIFQACREDADCAAAFAPDDPEDVARAVVADADDPKKRCLGADGPDRQTLESVLSTFVVADLGQTVPGVFRRLSRCSEQDQQELTALAAFLTDALDMPPDPSIDNGVLGVHVLRTDVMARLDTFPFDELATARDPLVFWSGAAPLEEFQAIVDGWPVNYAPAPMNLPDLGTPLLFLNGGLDIQTPLPWARELSTTLGATLVEVPFAGHAVDISLSSPLTAGDASCSLGIQRAFIADPSAELDTSCAATAYTPDVAGRSEVMQAVAKTLYGSATPLLGAPADAPSAKRVRSAQAGEAVAAVAETLRERLRRARDELPRWRRAP